MPASRGDQGAVARGADGPQPWLVAQQEAGHRAVALGQGQEGVAEANQPARGDVVLQAHVAAAVMVHVRHARLAQRARFSLMAPMYCSRVSMTRCSTGSVAWPSIVLAGDDLGARDLELVALAAHRLDQHGEMQFAAAGDDEFVGAGAIIDAQADIGLQLAIEARREAGATCSTCPLGRRRGWC